MSAIKKYFEKKVSLLSTSDVRYDGELYTVDPTEQSIALKHVNCMGTEGRRSGDQAIAPSDCTYEFIIFRAVNIRQLWLDEGGRKRDLTDEILIPLRQGQNVNFSQQKQRQDMYEDQHPKRKVGYQSRSSQQQGYGDPYYNQAPQYDYGRQGGGYGGYGQGPPENVYPPLPNQGQSYGGYSRQQQQYGAPPPPQTYYDAPNQQGIGGGGYYPQSGGGGYQQRGYGQRGYQRQRPPQYYNQQRAPQYYNQGYPPQPYYNQQRRYPQQYNRNYQSQRGYNQSYRGYNQQRRNPRYNQQRGSDTQAGTGAFLDNRRLRGDEIDIKDQQDFDFGAAKNEFDQSKDEQNGAMPPLQPQQQDESPVVEDKEKQDVNDKDAEKDDAKQSAVTEQEETKEQSKKYDKSKSFFDGLMTETKKSKPKQDMQQQKDIDTKTFGSVAQTYKSRHIQKQQQQRGGNRGYQQNYNRYRNQSNYQQNRYRNQGQQRSYQQYNRQQQQQQQSSTYTTNKWVVRR